jgi:hypothetical protein
MFRPTGTRLHSLFLLADLITQDFFSMPFGCNSDIILMKGDMGLPPMSTFAVHSPGHEGAGEII